MSDPNRALIRACRAHGLDILRVYNPAEYARLTALPVAKLPEPLKPIVLPERPDALDGLVAPQAARAIVRDICQAYNVTWAELRARCNKKRFTAPRRELYARLRDLGWSLPQVGRLVGRDHTSVYAAIEKLRGEP